MPKLFLSGNHDTILGGQNGLEVFRDIPGVTVITTPRIFRWEPLGCMASYWPWQWTFDQLPDFLQESRRAESKLLFGHAFLSGAFVAPDYVGIKPTSTLEAFGLAAPQGHLPTFDFGFFGDVHCRQELGKRSTSSVVWYPGSPYAQNWGERELDKGALYVDTEASTVTPVPVQAPRFRLVDWTDVADINTTLKANARSPEVAAWQGDFVRLVVGAQADMRWITALREASQARIFQLIIKRRSQVEQRVEVHAGMPHDEMLSRYVEARPPAQDLDRQALIAAGKRLLDG